MTKSDPLVSIIIPVYNVERYLDQCLASVVNQSYKNLEIILVDDGATDSSGKKCDSWAKKDAKIKVIHKQNEGLNYARKSGWEIATGEYVTFLDSDDLFHQDNVKNSLSALLKEKVDIAIYARLDFSDSDEKNKLKPKITKQYEVKTSTAEIFRFLLLGNYNSIYTVTAWGKLYKREMIDAVDWRVSNFRAFEDNFFTPQILDQASSLVILNQQLYFYRRNNEGAALSRMLVGNTHNGNPVGYLECQQKIKDFWGTLFQKHNIDLDEKLEEYWFSNAIFRLNNLIDSNLLGSENNIDYVGDIIRKMQKREAHCNQIINQQAKTNTSLEQEMTRINQELQYLKTPRGAIGNTARVIKRRFIKPTKG